MCNQIQLWVVLSWSVILLQGDNDVRRDILRYNIIEILTLYWHLNFKSYLRFHLGTILLSSCFKYLVFIILRIISYYSQSFLVQNIYLQSIEMLRFQKKSCCPWGRVFMSLYRSNEIRLQNSCLVQLFTFMSSNPTLVILFQNFHQLWGSWLTRTFHLMLGKLWRYKKLHSAI